MRRLTCAISIAAAHACAAEPDAVGRDPTDGANAESGLSDLDVPPNIGERDALHGEPDSSVASGGPPSPVWDATPVRLDSVVSEPDSACGAAPACSVLDIERLQLRILPLCAAFRVPDGSAALRVFDAETWDEVVRSCVWGDGNELPEVDWSTQEILGYRADIDCPLGTVLLGAESCGDAFVVHRWTWSDLCSCDYLEEETDLFLVGRGVYSRVEFVHHEEAPCAEVQCDCNWSPDPVSACESGGGCLEVGSNERDGLPPEAWGGGCRP